MKLNVDMAFENETGMEKKNWAIGFKPMGIGKKKNKKIVRDNIYKNK